MRWEDLQAPCNLTHIKRVGLYRALGGRFNLLTSNVRLLNLGWGALSQENEVRLAKTIRRLNALWFASTPREQEEIALYLDKSRQPQPPPKQTIKPASVRTPQALRAFSEKGFSLHAYQHRAIQFADRARCTLALEMGLGKTLIALFSLCRAQERGLINRAVILAPRSAHGSWARHFEDFAPSIPLHIISGWPPKKREETYTEFYYGRLPIIVLTPQSMLVDHQYWRKIFKDHGAQMALVFDEVHKAKSESSGIGALFEELSPLAARVLGLTGTPQPNTIGDLYHIVERVSPNALGDLDTFASRYTYRELSTWDSIRGATYQAGPLKADKLNALRQALEPHFLAISALDDDVNIELPPRLDLAPYIPLDDLQKEITRALQIATAEREIYKRMYEQALRGERGDLLQIAAEGAPKNEQALGIRIEQCAISPALFSARFAELYPDYESPKVGYLADQTTAYLREHPTRAAVVFCEHLKGLDEMEKALKRRGVQGHDIMRYTGSTSQKQRRAIVHDLNYGDVKVLLGQTNSLETGANLQRRAAFVGHLSIPWSPDVLAQSTARVVRQGQLNEVVVLMPSGSRVEEAKNRALSRKLLQSGAASGLSSSADIAIIKTASDPRVRNAHRDIALNMRYNKKALKTLIERDLCGSN